MKSTSHIHGQYPRSERNFSTCPSSAFALSPNTFSLGHFKICPRYASLRVLMHKSCATLPYYYSLTPSPVLAPLSKVWGLIKMWESSHSNPLDLLQPGSLRAYSWICPGITPGGTLGTIWMPTIKPGSAKGSAECKARVLLAILSPQGSFSWCWGCQDQTQSCCAQSMCSIHWPICLSHMGLLWSHSQTSLFHP